MPSVKIESYYFHHNGDYSGDVIIVNHGKEEFKVSFSALKEFVAEYIRSKSIAKIEQMSTNDLLKLLKY